MGATHAVSNLVPYDQWLAEVGISSTTGWRWRKRGAIKTVTIYGRQYISRDEIQEFERRAVAGELAANVKAAQAVKNGEPL